MPGVSLDVIWLRGNKNNVLFSLSSFWCLHFCVQTNLAPHHHPTVPVRDPPEGGPGSLPTDQLISAQGLTPAHVQSHLSDCRAPSLAQVSTPEPKSCGRRWRKPRAEVCGTQACHREQGLWEGCHQTNLGRVYGPAPLAPDSTLSQQLPLKYITSPLSGTSHQGLWSQSSGEAFSCSSQA